MDAYHSIVARIAERGGTVVALGGLDSGKTTFCRTVAEVAIRLGKTVAYVDTDVGQSTVGPPTTIGLKFLSTMADLEPAALARADSLYFVGAVTPVGHMLPMVIGAITLTERARAAGVDVVLVDTTGFIGGQQGQVLKLYKIEGVRPDWVVGFQRGAELEPILGAVRRALPPEVESLEVADRIAPTSIEERMDHRRAALRAVFEPPLQRWKVKPSVIVPALPEELDPRLLDGLLVGMDDGKGACLGLGVLEYRDGLRMVSAVSEGAKALRLGSVKVTPDYATHALDLRDLFVSD